MKRSLTIPLVLALGLTAVPARAQDDETTAIDDTPHITIVGTAETELAPDLATIALGVAIEKPTAKAATEAEAQAAQAVVAEAKAEGVVAGDIATRSLTLEQTFDEIRDASGRNVGRKPRGFAATEMFEIRVRDLAKAGALAQALIDKGADRFDGIAYAIEHPQPVLDRLAAEAVRAARRQAQLAADAAGVKLGRVLLIERPGETARLPSPMMAMRRVATPLPVEAGSRTLAVEMEVTWAIE
jgi:uncharacterized protein YggE